MCVCVCVCVCVCTCVVCVLTACVSNFYSVVFGVDLTTIAKMDGADIPNVVKECIEAIEARGTFPYIIHNITPNILMSSLHHSSLL